MGRKGQEWRGSRKGGTEKECGEGGRKYIANTNGGKGEKGVREERRGRKGRGRGEEERARWEEGR